MSTGRYASRAVIPVAKRKINRFRHLGMKKTNAGIASTPGSFIQKPIPKAAPAAMVFPRDSKHTHNRTKNATAESVFP